MYNDYEHKGKHPQFIDGVEYERERIIALLEEKAFPDPNEWVCESLDALIALIKGEN